MRLRGTIVHGRTSLPLGGGVHLRAARQSPTASVQAIQFLMEELPPAPRRSASRNSAGGVKFGLLSHFSASVTTCRGTPKTVKPCHFNCILARHDAHMRQGMPHSANRADTTTDTGFFADNLTEPRFWITSASPTTRMMLS